MCAEFGFQDRRGRFQVAGCLKALRVLEARSEAIVLPPPQTASVRSGPSLLETPIALPVGVPKRLSEIAELEIVAVSSREERRVWNTLMAREHPHGITTFAGCQMRYLVGSGHGVLGAAGFSAAALRLAARERWMAWDDGQRREHLDRVVCLSRFLIRPGVACAYLASHVLGRILRRLPRDFEIRYGYRPWLVETFLEAQYDGASLRAANFVRVGETAGRGRQDRENRWDRPVKSVFMYALCPHWRRCLGVPDVDPFPVLEPGEGLGADVWAMNEFGGAQLGDRRLTARLVKSATLLAAYPGRAISANVESDEAAVNGFYRLIEQPADSEVTVENILAPHRERTVGRMRGQSTVLAIQDGSELNFARRPHSTGLQIIGKNQTSATTLGLHLHATLAVNGDGLPLGVLRLGFDEEGRRKAAAADSKRKTRRWLDGFEDTLRATRALTRKTRVISVCDCEADFFELFDAQRRSPGVDLLVRARPDRCLDTEQKLFATVSSGPAAGMIEVEIERLGERKKSSEACPARTKRLAHCALRFCRATLPATIKGARPVPVSAVHIVECNPPETEDPLQWFLLTTVAVDDAATAAEIIGFYLKRWRIEDFFRVLKSGCRTEFLMFRTADRLQRAIAINAVIAWRIMVMTLLGREVPDCGADLLFTDHELNFLRHYAAKSRLNTPDTLGNAVRLVAHLGGYRGRTHDPEPGNQIMWQGYSTLTKATIGHQIGHEFGFEDGKRYMLEQVQKHVV